MSITAKKITGLFFIVLGMMPMLCMLIFVLQKKQIRERMKEELEHGILVTVVLPEKEVVWMDDHEIWVNNSMFDIATKKLENGVFTFTGMYDEEETKLVEKESEAAGESDNKLLSQLFKCLPEFWKQSDQQKNISHNRDRHETNYTERPVQQFREIITPPPQVSAI